MMALDEALPLPFRILSLLVLSAWLWNITYRIAAAHNINLVRLLRLDSKFSSTQHESKCINISIIAILSYLSHVTFHDSASESLSIWDFIPLLVICWCVFHLCSPKTSRLATSFKRILRGDIDRDIRTNDILLSDTLTSFSKVLVDVAIYLCHLYNFQTCFPKLSGPKLDRQCGEQIMLDTLVGSAPNFIRLAQCYKEWKVTGDPIHLWNFAKYTSNIPVLLIGLLMRTREGYSQLWILFAFFNSCYTFYWDVINDWQFDLFKKTNLFLRSKLHYTFNSFYYTVIFLDFVGRFIWVTKFLPSPTESSSLLYLGITSLFSSESGWFTLEIIEILRRWLWVLVKVEVDYINLTNRDIEMNNMD